MKDGLVCGLAFAQGERAHSLQLHSGLTESKQLELLRLLTELAPIAESA